MRQVSLNQEQLDLVIGSLLGDGHLVKTTRGFAFRVNHGPNQKEYVDWKYGIVKDFVRTSPQPANKCYYFRTISHAAFDQLRNIFYDSSGRKQLPGQFIEQNLNDFVLAVWYMDDGTRETNQVRINSQNFTLEEQRELQRILRAKLGIDTTINRDQKWFRLRVSARSMEQFRKRVVPHIHPSMLYKLPPVTTDSVNE